MMDHAEEDEAEEEIERFDDFTIASSWERFISKIEAVCRLWLADGPNNLLEKGAVPVESAGNLYMASKEFKYNSKSYSMDYYFRDKHIGKIEEWADILHDLQLYFGVDEFLVIAPQSASGVVLDSPEASKLLSAVAIALSNCSSLWPAFVPVHDPSRSAYIGIQNMGTVYTRRFESDYIGTQVPIKLMHLEGLHELFVAKFAFSTMEFSSHIFKVRFTMRLTYRTLPDDEDDDYVQEESVDNKDSIGDSRVEFSHKTQWDDDCPWSEWYSAEDPIKGFELMTIWSEKTIESSLEMAEMENSTPHDAHDWLLRPIFPEILAKEQGGSAVGFASQLTFIVSALQMSFEAEFLEDFVSDKERTILIDHKKKKVLGLDFKQPLIMRPFVLMAVDSGSDNMKSPGGIPAPTVVDRVLKEIFHEGADVQEFTKIDNKNSRAVKGAPLESLFTQFCLHALWSDNCNIRAIAMLWIEFVREVRWYWEESQTLPRMPVDSAIDLSTCLINQKLQMLAICIKKKHEADPHFRDSSAGQNDKQGDSMMNDPVHEQGSAGDLDKKSESQTRKELLQSAENSQSEAKTPRVSAEQDPLDKIRRGSAGVLGTMMLLNTQQKMHTPFTQDPPLMTDDMHEERASAIEALGDSYNFSAQLEKDILLSDMSSFKAANPEAVFEDFIRWHSPGDWNGDAETQGKEPSWPPRGRLSKRMSEQGNYWRKLWTEAPALAVDEQKPLWDPNREAEKVLHYLETVRPHQLLEQMVCTAFRAAADTINQTAFGDMNQMRTKLDQLYMTMASTLRPLQMNQLSQESEVIQDIRQLCNIFEHVEKMVHVAASLHRKFLRAPRLSTSIFGDYYKFYLPRMGSSSPNHNNVHEEYKQKIKVGWEERNVVTDLFKFPTANQSWRRVLSMGNLLNGNEPVLREIIFSMRDNVGGNHHYSPSRSDSLYTEMGTYRMYISGSSNDLRVALSIVSCD